MEQTHSLEQSVRETTRALSLVVDREMAKREALLHTLALSPALTDNDLPAFYRYAKAVAPTLETVIILADASGQQFLNIRQPLGAPLPRTVFFDLRRQSGPAVTLVSDLYFAPTGKQYSFAVEVPVVRDGRVLYYIGMGRIAAQLQKVLADQRLPQQWIGTVVDRQGNVVARSIDPERFVSKTVSSVMRDQLREHQQGFFESKTIDGIPVLAFFSRSPVYGWGFLIGLPKSEIQGAAIRAAALFAGLTALLLGLGVVGALWVGRQIVRPVHALTKAAGALGRGDAVGSVVTGLDETDAVGHALSAASEQIRGAMRSWISASPKRVRTPNAPTVRSCRVKSWRRWAA